VYKKDGVQTHRLAEEMLPVYRIAITQKRFLIKTQDIVFF